MTVEVYNQCFFSCAIPLKQNSCAATLTSHSASYKIDKTSNNTDEAHIWIAIAHIKPPRSTTSKQPTQSLAVRELLKQLMQSDVFAGLYDACTHLCLDEQRLPYRLSPTEHYVSFSHSGNQVACAISTKPVGIDIENHDIKPAVIQRFFHTEEVKWLLSCQKSIDQPEFERASKLLWMIKEARLKQRTASKPHQSINLLTQLKTNDLKVVKQFLHKHEHQITDPYSTHVNLTLNNQTYMSDTQLSFVAVI